MNKGQMNKRKRRQEKGLKMGQFVLGNSLIHQLDPRTKILGTLVIIFSILFNFKWYVIMFSAGVIILSMYLSQIKIPIILRSLYKLRYLLLLSFIFQAVLKDGTPLFYIGSIDVTREGIELGFNTVLRLLILYLSSTMLTMTTSPLKLASGMEALLSPLRYLRLPVHQFSMLISTSLRFIPTIIEESEIITRAQQSRGAQFNSPGLITKLKSFMPVLIPLLAASLQRASDLALAMESRCYTGGTNQIRLKGLRLRKRDGLAICLISLLLILSVIFI